MKGRKATGEKGEISQMCFKSLILVPEWGPHLSEGGAEEDERRQEKKRLAKKKQNKVFWT